MRSAHVLLLVAAFLQTQAGALATVRWNDALDVGALGSAAAGHQQVLSAGSSKNAASPVVSQDSYEGHQVWRFDLNSMTAEEQRDFLRRIEDLSLDLWKATPAYADIRLDAQQMDALVETGDVKARLLIESVQSLVDASRPVSSSSAISTSGQYPTDTLLTPFHDAYHDIDGMYAFLDDLARDFSGGEDGLEVETFIVGKSAEGRDIKGIRARMATPAGVAESMTKGKKQPKKPKKPSGPQILRELVLQSGQHAREWIGPATAVYYFHSLIVAGRADSTSEAARLLRSFTFTVVPTINPDGYAYSHEHSRMWRKNRQDLGEKCQGIDLNSNWGYKWRPTRGESPCSDSYPGKEAFEAVEARVMANYLANGSSLTGEFFQSSSGQPVQRKVRSFIDLHSYGQLFMFPFAHSCDDFPPDAEMLMEAGLGVAKSMRTIHGEAYQSGQACDLTYRAPGDAIDYAYGVTDIRWSYSAELRDTGTYGFMLPPSLIRSAAEETTAGLMYLGKFIYNLEIAG